MTKLMGYWSAFATKKGLAIAPGSGMKNLEIKKVLS